MTDLVEVQSDFLQRQAKAQPVAAVAAVAQLIWNSLDVDATEATKTRSPHLGVFWFTGHESNESDTISNRKPYSPRRA